MSEFIWMIGSDFHIPYTNKRYMDLWWQVMRDLKPQAVDIVGDLDDACPVSRFSDGQPSEILDAVFTYAPLVQDFFRDCRQYADRDADIFFHGGNHEIRYQHYVNKNAPALRNLLTEEVLWKTDTYGVQTSSYEAPPVHRYGDIYGHHGLYVSSNAGGSVAKMMDEFGVSIISGHSHRQGYVPKTYELRNETLRGWELGHMTDITSPGMAYATHHPWQPGFAVAWVESGSSVTKDGLWPHVELVSISPDYTCKVGNKIYKA